MTLTDRRTVDPPVPSDDGVPLPALRSGRLRGLVVVAGIAVVVALLAQFPLIKNHIFYYWDDSASAFLPHWYQMGLQIRSGHWPVLDLTQWMGGNLAAEAQLSVLNPVSLANYVLVSLLPDLAFAADVVKTEFLVLFAIGAYLLAREYRAGRTAAAVVAVALPFAGYTLYFDAGSWAAGLMAFAWLPLFWWASRRFSRSALNPVVPVAIGYLAMSTGSPYGALGVLVILLAVAVERALLRDWWRVGGVVLVGAAIGISAIAVFLPLLGSSAVTWRTSAGVFNDGFMVPHLGDLLAASAPTYLPQYRAFAGEVLTVPTMYIAWFVVPLAPWLSWSTLRGRARELAGVGVFALIYLAFLFGPSNLWLFRWPARLTEYAVLPIGVVFALVLTWGIRTDRWKVRASVSVALVLAGAYLSWAVTPRVPRRHVVATLLVLALFGAVIWLARRRPRYVAPTMVLGTALTLLLQSYIYTANNNITPWRFPHNVAAMRADFGQRYQGNTLEVADVAGMASAGLPITPDGAWRDILLANAIHAAGVNALNSYTGIGDVAFGKALCMNYFGGTCADAYHRVWQQAEGTNVDLADALRLQTVVMLNGYTDQTPDVGGDIDMHPQSVVEPGAPPPPIPPGWSVQQRTSEVTVLHRDAPLAFPGGRLSWQADQVRVRADAATGDAGERTEYTGSGRVLFAALAWPGWQATVDGHPVTVEQGPAGLIAVDLPASAPGGSTLELSFTPPGFGVGIPALIFGLLVGLVYGVVWEVRRLRGRRMRRTAELT